MQRLQADLAARYESAPIVVLTHRPMFDQNFKWDWGLDTARRREGFGVIDAV